LPKIRSIFDAKRFVETKILMFGFSKLVLKSRQAFFDASTIRMANQIYRATVRYAGDDFFIGTTPSGHAQAIDTKGERKSAPTPMEMLLVSVAACTAADVVSILEKKRQNVSDYRIEISGERREERPQAFVKFHIRHIVYGRDVSEHAVAHAIELSDTKYCSVAATVRPTAEITTSFEIVENKV